MNIARVIEVDGAPMLIIYPKKHGTHAHTDIKGLTELRTGACFSRRFEGEFMPQRGEATTLWLISKTQEALGARIEVLPWDGGIDIARVVHSRLTAAA